MKLIELLTVQLTYPELQSLPIELRRRISRRWKRAIKCGVPDVKDKYRQAIRCSRSD